MHWALNRGSSAKHSTWYPRVLKLWMVFAKRWTSSYGYPPNPTCCALGFQTLQKIRPNQQWPTTHGESPQQETHCNAQGQNVQEEFNNRSSSRQLQSSSKNMQQTNMLCYDPQLQGYFIWHCHLSHDPLAATSLDHRCTLVQVTYNTFKSSATSYKNTPKTEQWKTVHKLNCRTMTTVKTVVYIVQWVHMCPTACKWHQTTYKWKQLTSTPKTVKWTSHELKSQDMKNSKLVQLSNTYKTDAQLLQDSLTASANRTGSPDNSSLHSFCKQLGTDSFCCS